jgi:hypothetical protein
MNPGAKKFYRKLSDQAFNQVLRHKISSCTWDARNKIVTSPRAVTEMAATAKFEQQDWVRQLTGVNATQSAKQQHVDPNMAFPFGDDFSVGTIHSAKAKTKVASPAMNEVVVIQDNNDDVSVLTTRTAANNQSEVTVGSRVASSSNPAIGPTAKPTQTETASGGSPDPPSAGLAGGDAGGPNGKYSPWTSPLHQQEGRLNKRKADHVGSGQLQGAEEASNVRRGIDGMRLTVGSDSFYLHVWN